MSEHLLMLTGKLAKKSLEKVMASIEGEDFTYEIHNPGISVAALMTTDMIQRRLDDVRGADRIIVPGLCAGNVDEVSEKLGVPVVRGPKDLKDLPVYFGKGAEPPDLSQYDVRIFAEIVDAPDVSIENVLAQASSYKADGADVIDVGCLPGREFPQMEEIIKTLVSEGYTVSLDSVDPDQLVRGGQAGAHYLLSLKESTLWVADEVNSVPILIPESPEDPDSLYRAIDAMQKNSKAFIADSILDPIHFGFTRSIVRYQQLRDKYPNIEIMMGTGNLSELTEADTVGLNTMMLGMMSEMRITNLLTTEVSEHATRSVAELDLGRRIMYRAREDTSLPKGYSAGLTGLHERKPFPYDLEEVEDTASQIKDANYRIQVTEEGIHIYNRDGLKTDTDPFALFEHLKTLEEDAPHAYYIGVELARAQIAWQLGKRYIQDEELDWGVAYKSPLDNGKADPHMLHKAEGATMKARKERRKKVKENKKAVKK
ncbi:MAG: DUF6513 domain-containing protein [Gammaproteobacteria bacterium]